MIPQFCIPLSKIVGTGTVRRLLLLILSTLLGGFFVLFGLAPTAYTGEQKNCIDPSAELTGPSCADTNPLATPSSEEKAINWLEGQTVRFHNVTQIPGYGRSGCDNRVVRYNDDASICYPAVIGDALISFNYCNYGTPDQQAFLGRWGRASLYDQAVGAIAWLMVDEPEKARRILDYVSSYQNLDVPINGVTNGSFGFSFNSVGCPDYAPDNRDSFYDLAYLRSGAISWIGYAFTMYHRLTGDDRYIQVARNIGEYLLTQQISDPSDPRAGLLRGGNGRYDTTDWSFTTGQIEWVSTEHNIDAYFFLRDLGIVSGEEKYSLAAKQIRSAMLARLWNDDKGRFEQGMTNQSGQIDTGDALDAASWGALFLSAIGESDKAQRSLDYAESVYRNDFNGHSGYKPYAGTAEGFDWDPVKVIWSEGSLGVAMAYLKLGNRDRTAQILSEMADLQALDTDGGLFYALSSHNDLTDFPAAPSVAGSAWYLMVLRSHADSSMLAAFWTADLTEELFLPLVTNDSASALKGKSVSIPETCGRETLARHVPNACIHQAIRTAPR